MGYIVFTEAPDTMACGCGSASGWCPTLADTIRDFSIRGHVFCQLAEDARVALEMARRTFAIKLSIIR